jgi:hypothetical protein
MKPDSIRNAALFETIELPDFDIDAINGLLARGRRDGTGAYTGSTIDLDRAAQPIQLQQEKASVLYTSTEQAFRPRTRSGDTPARQRRRFLRPQPLQASAH